MADNLHPEDRVARAEVNRIDAELDRDAAVNVAANEIVNRDIAETRATDANIAAAQAHQTANELATDRHVLRHELAHERFAATNSAFGFYLTLGVLLAAILVGGLYLYYRSQNPAENVIVNAAPAPSGPASVIVAPSGPAVAPSPSPITINTPPPVVNVTPSAQPAPNVNINVAPASPAPATSGTDSSTPASGTAGTITNDNRTGADSGSSTSNSGG